MRTHSGKITKTFAQFEGFIFDIEGVIIRGETVLPAAIETVNILKAHKRLVFLSNISDLSREDVAVKLQRLGFDVETDDIMTSGFATIMFLKEHYPDKKNCYVVGSESFEKELKRNGFKIINGSGDPADFTVIGLDYELNYEKICQAAAAIKNGSRFIATNLAKIKLTSDGFGVGPGFTVKGLEYITGKTAELMGKPSSTIFNYCVKKLGLSANQVLMVGDKLEQDIYGGNAIGAATCLVLSGASGKDALKVTDAKYKPTFVIENIGKLIE